MNLEVKKNMIRWLLDLFFPNRCPICNEVIVWNEKICDNCKNKLEYVNDDEICEHCGKPQCICNGELYYDSAVVLCYYDGLAKKGIYSLKINSSIKYFGEFLGEKLADKLLKTTDIEKFDFIIPVPISNARRKKRRFNQSAVIGEEIGKYLHLPIYDNVLIKTDLSEEQHTFKTRSQRLQNAEKLFTIKDINLKGKHIILCDDIITTGGTINKCAKLLKDKGAETVMAVVGTTTEYKQK